MSRTRTLRQILAEQGLAVDSLPQPEISPFMEPPPTGNEPEDDEDFDPTGIIAPRGAPVVPIQCAPPWNQLSHGMWQQLVAFETIRAELGFPREATRPSTLDPALVAALVQRWGDDHDPSEILRDEGEHDPADYSSIDFIRLMFYQGERIMLQDGDDGILWLHEIKANDFGPMVHSDDLQFQINPLHPGNREESPVTAAFRHVLLRFSTLPEFIALWVLLLIPVWVRAVYRRPGSPVEALLKIDANTPGEFDAYVTHLGPHLAAAGADQACLTSTAFSRLPVARRNDMIEDILYMDTRPIPVRARPIIPP